MGQKIILSSIIFFITVIIIAQFFAQPDYLWTENTVSELAAQDHANKAIMQIGFIGFGLIFNIGLILKIIETQQLNVPGILLMLYGIAILITGFYSERPIDSTISYAINEAKIHSLFAMIAGFSLSFAILWNMITSASVPEKITHLIFLFLVMGFSIAYGFAENGALNFGKGIIQRSLYLVSFIWLYWGQTLS